MEKRVKSVKFNAIMNTALTASNMLVSLVTIPYVTRVLSVSGYGDVGFAQSVSMWLSAFCLVGIPTYGIRECARVRDDPVALAQIVRELLIIITVCTLVVLIPFGICIELVPRLRAISSLMWVFWVGTLLLSYGVEWYFQAIEDYAYITIRSVAFKILSLILIICLVRGSDDWFIYGLILALITSGNNIFNIVRMFHNVPMSGIGEVRIRRHIKPLASYSVLSIASSLYLYFDSVLLGMCSIDNTEVAFYQLATKVKGVLAQILTAIINALVPRLSYYAVKDRKQYRRLLGTGMWVTVNLCMGIMCFLFVFSGPLMILISSKKYVGAILPMQIMGGVILFSGLNTFLGFCVLCPLGEEKKLAAANLLGVPISVGLNVLFDSKLGALGAAISVLIAEITIFCSLLKSTYRILKDVSTISQCVKMILAHMVSVAVSFALATKLNVINKYEYNTIYSLEVLLAGFVVYGLSWLIISLNAKENTALWLKRQVMNKIVDLK